MHEFIVKMCSECIWEKRGGKDAKSAAAVGKGDSAGGSRDVVVIDDDAEDS